MLLLRFMKTFFLTLPEDMLLFVPENMLMLPEDMFVLIPEDTLYVVPKSMSSQFLEYFLMFAVEDRTFLNGFTWEACCCYS